VTNKYSP